VLRETALINLTGQDCPPIAEIMIRFIVSNVKNGFASQNEAVLARSTRHLGLLTALDACGTKRLGDPSLPSKPFGEKVVLEVRIIRIG